MSIHMTRVETSEGCCPRIDGRLEEGSLAEFEQACESVDGELTLDVGGVT